MVDVGEFVHEIDFWLSRLEVVPLPASKGQMRFDVAMRCSANGSLLVLMAGIGGGSSPPLLLAWFAAFHASLLRRRH